MEDKEIKELEKAVEQIWEVARRFGLDPYPTNFEIVPATVMYEVGSYALAGPLFTLDLRQNLSPHEDDVRLRSLEDLRSRHQHKSVLRLSCWKQIVRFRTRW
jgi:hypothetical protein